VIVEIGLISAMEAATLPKLTNLFSAVDVSILEELSTIPITEKVPGILYLRIST